MNIFKFSILLIFLAFLSSKGFTEEKILLVPISKIDFQLLRYLSLNIEKIFKAEVEIGEPIPIPDYAYNPHRAQYNSSLILENYRKSQEYDKVLLIADFDLYTNGLNFVFGEAGIWKGVAIISITRLRQEFYGLPKDENLFKERCLKEAVHELGHLYGLRHCTDPKCVMHFSNTLADTDRKFYNFCPEHRKELERRINARENKGK